MLEKLYEIVEANPTFTKLFEAKDKSPFLATIEMTVLPADKKNKNNRYYPESIVKRETEKMQEKLKTQNIAGALSHDPTGLAKLSAVSHAITKIWFDEKTKSAKAQAHVLRTGSGKDLLTLLDANIVMGASVVGNGEVASDGRIMDNYTWRGIDLVAAPSFGDATKVDAENLLESANTVIEKETIIEKEKQKNKDPELLVEQKKVLREELRLAGAPLKPKKKEKKETIDDGLTGEERKICGGARTIQ